MVPNIGSPFSKWCQTSVPPFQNGAKKSRIKRFINQFYLFIFYESCFISFQAASLQEIVQENEVLSTQLVEAQANQIRTEVKGAHSSAHLLPSRTPCTHTLSLSLTHTAVPTSYPLAPHAHTLSLSHTHTVTYERKLLLYEHTR